MAQIFADEANTPDPTGVLLQAARLLGFELAGVAAAGEPRHFAEYCRWIENGSHAGMDYLERHKKQRQHPESILPGVQSLLMLGVSYRTVLQNDSETDISPVTSLAGIAEYARGRDYHDWIRHRLKILSQKHRELFPHERCRGVVDTAPVMERDFAVQAGLGQVGKNTMLIHTDRRTKIGSKFFLAALLSTALLQHKSNPFNPPSDPCGDCRACMDACPMTAIVEPFQLDARRCLNYWTIEHRGNIPHEIREQLGKHFFGCDTCQAVCPWNDGVPEIVSGTIDPHSLSKTELMTMAVGTPLQRRLQRD